MNVKMLTLSADVLGSGTTSTVYGLGSKAIKIMDFDDAASAITELIIIDKIKSDRVISILDFDYTESNITLTMNKYMGSLADTYSQNTDIYKVSRQLIEGVMMIHKAGFIHGDIKPENLLLDSDSNLVVADFGITLPIDEKYHRTSVQTVTYRAPEVDDDTSTGKFGPKIDMWSVGCIIYLLLTGKLYVNWEESRYCNDNIKLIGDVYGISTHPRTVIKRILRDATRDYVKTNIIERVGKALYDVHTELVELMIECLMPNPKRRIDSLSAYSRIMSICKIEAIPRYKLLPYVGRTPLNINDLEIVNGVDESVKTIFKIEALNFANNTYLHMHRNVDVLVEPPCAAETNPTRDTVKYAALYLTACIYSVKIYEPTSKFMKLLGVLKISVDELSTICLKYIKLAKSTNS